MTSASKLYALLVGINRYSISPLNGCLNDIKKVEAFLQSKYPGIIIEKLVDEAATKSAIVNAFENFLSKATAGDAILFYFSGHGAQEDADPIWRETDNKHEDLVCYDRNLRPEDFLMTNKELRYLIYRIAEKGAHIATIFDCCHAGGNTRNAPLINAAFAADAPIIKRISGAFPKRQWKDFIFSHEIQRPIDKTLPEVFLPQGKHIQLAACDSDESAVEINSEGVFTKTLLQVLKTSGNVSYAGLLGRIRQYMRFVYEQQPQFYSYDPLQTLEHKTFLNTQPALTMIGEAIRNPHGKWMIHLGAIHGVKNGQPIHLVDTEKSNTKIDAKVTSVFIDFSIIEPDKNTFSGDDNKVYAVELGGLTQRTLKIHLINHDGHPADMKALADILVAQLSGAISLETEEKDADYTLHVRYGEGYITHPGDSFRPLIKPVTLDNKANIAQMAEMLQHIARYKFIHELENPDTDIPAVPLQIDMWSVSTQGREERIPVFNDDVTVNYSENLGEWSGQLKIKVTNTTSTKLYVCAVYLSRDFSANINFLPAKVESLPNQGDSIWLKFGQRDILQLDLDSVMRDYNWPAMHETIRFFISTHPFSPESLQLPALPSPATIDGEGDRGGFKLRDVKTPVQDWTAQSLNITFNNPLYNKVDPGRLDKILSREDMNYFALGLYFNLKPNQYLQPETLVLKEGITVEGPAGGKSFFGDLKINLANKIERMQRNRRYENVKNSGRIRIVAEGDSWFQYPILVKDILDHLSAFYAVRSLAAAGDTLRNYMMENEFIDAIDKEKPAFFLISGGGNDILGEQFREFLQDNVNHDPGALKKYLKDSFFQELDSLQQVYKTLFATLTGKYPKLQIIVHGYDYVIPLDMNLPENKKKSSWLGKYMIEKGMKDQAFRESLIRFILDEFNSRLEAVAAEYSQVHYIDARGVVKIRTYWFDEIHPTDKGFQDVAMKFINVINEVAGKV